MSLTKLPLGRNNSVMMSLFPPRESLVVTSRLGTAGVAGLDASVASAIAVESNVAVDSAFGDVTVVVGFLWSEILL
jgi:hypothetical protein